MKTISLNDATATQIAAFASSMLGIDADLRMGKDKIIAKMKAVGYASDAIKIEEDDDAPAPTVLTPAAGTDGRRKMITIMIPEQDAPGGSEAVYTNINGVSLLIPRSVEATIPVEYEEALRHAVAIRYDPDPNGGLGRKREVPQYPYSVVKPAHYIEAA